MDNEKLRLLRTGDAEFLWKILPADAKPNKSGVYHLTGQKFRFGYGASELRRVTTRPICRACGKRIARGADAIGINYDFTNTRRLTGLPLIWVHRNPCLIEKMTKDE